MTQTRLRVSGMSCGHCEKSVEEAISALPGVESVNADHATGEVVVTAERPIDVSELREPVAKAGYELVEAV